MCCSESQNWLIITVLKFTRNPISIVVYIKTGQRNTIYHRDNEKARKSSEHGPENGKRKFNQTRRRSDNGRSARVDCHIYRKRNKYRQSRCYTFSAFAWTLHFFQFCHQRGKRCNLFSFSSKEFGNLKKDVKEKGLVNSVKYYHYPRPITLIIKHSPFDHPIQAEAISR